MECSSDIWFHATCNMYNCTGNFKWHTHSHTHTLSHTHTHTYTHIHTLTQTYLLRRWKWKGFHHVRPLFWFACSMACSCAASICAMGGLSMLATPCKNVMKGRPTSLGSSPDCKVVQAHWLRVKGERERACVFVSLCVFVGEESWVSAGVRACELA